MTVNSSKPAKRRTQAERRDTARRRIMDATIECLASEGYAATTTSLVAKRANISRGGMLHHFPSKIDLIIMVVEDIETRAEARRRAEFMQLSKGENPFIALTEIAWNAMKEPEEIAMLEVLMASRGDKELSQRLPAVAQKADADKFNGMRKIAMMSGFQDDDLIIGLHRLHSAAMRGLMLENLFFKDAKSIDASIDLLKRYKQLLVEDVSSTDQ